MSPIQKLLKEGADALVTIQTYKDELDSIAETIENKCGIEKAAAKKAIAKYHQSIYNSEKYAKSKLESDIVFAAVESCHD